MVDFRSPLDVAAAATSEQFVIDMRELIGPHVSVHRLDCSF